MAKDGESQTDGTEDNSKDTTNSGEKRYLIGII